MIQNKNIYLPIILPDKNKFYLPHNEVKKNLKVPNDFTKKKYTFTQVKDTDLKNKIEYKAIINIENLKNGLKRTKSNVFPGIDGEIKKDINNKRIIKLYNDLKSQKYKPQKSKRVAIPKPNRDV